MSLNFFFGPRPCEIVCNCNESIDNISDFAMITQLCHLAIISVLVFMKISTHSRSWQWQYGVVKCAICYKKCPWPRPLRFVFSLGFEHLSLFNISTYQ